MRKNNVIDEVLSREDLSDETIYAIYDFLLELLTEFESKGFCRLRNCLNDELKFD